MGKYVCEIEPYIQYRNFLGGGNLLKWVAVQKTKEKFYFYDESGFLISVFQMQCLK